MEGLLHEDLTYKIRGCAYEVARHLGLGFLEKVYERALVHELCSQGIRAQAQIAIPVRYKGALVGDYYADILVENRVVVEIKATRSHLPEHQAQLLNYLRATGLRIGLLINFGQPRLMIKRVIW